MVSEFPGRRLIRASRRATIREGLATAPLDDGRVMTTWEYLTTPLLIHNTAAILNNWGKQGWELVQVVQGPEGGLVAYLKRPVGAGEANSGLGAAAEAAKQFGGEQ